MKRTKPKRYANCKVCQASIVKVSNALYREDNKEEIAEYAKKYKVENKDKIKTNAKKYSDSHKAQTIISQQNKRLRDSGLTVDEQNATLKTWETWYIYCKARDQRHEYEIALTILKKRQIMGD